MAPCTRSPREAAAPPDSPPAPPFGAPAHLVGRERELGVLREALAAAAQGACRVVLVDGPSGVGKSALINELRGAARTHAARFVAGKFDQHNEKEAAAILQALGALGRQLLAEPAEQRTQLRGKVLRVLGSHAGLVRAVPGFKLLLGDVGEATSVDPAHAAARMVEVVAGLLRAVASVARPVVLVLDDLQWSQALSTRLIDAVLGSAELHGLLLIGAYRNNELPPGHPLAAALERWASDGNGPVLLHVANLDTAGAALLVRSVLDASPAQSAELAQALAPCAHGSPFDLLEMLNALRVEGLLYKDEQAWRWDSRSVGGFAARTTARDALAAHVAALPPAARALLQALACLGAQTSREVARVAVALAPGEFQFAIAELRSRGFLAAAPRQHGLLTLRHDHVQHAAYASVPPRARASLHLQLARRLAAARGLEGAAADQYVNGAAEISGPAECVQAAALLVREAAQARTHGSHEPARRMLAAALSLLDRAATAVALPQLAACEIDYHDVLCSLGMREEADGVYRRIASRGIDVLSLSAAACAQVTSLTTRNRLDEALALGMGILREFGLGGPFDVHDDGKLREAFGRLRHWAENFDLAAEIERARAGVPGWVGAAGKMQFVLNVAGSYTDRELYFVIDSAVLWERYGPCGPLALCLTGAGQAAARLDGDWRISYLVAKNVLALSQACGWDTEAAQARYGLVLNGLHWFEPMERCVREAERAREALLAVGDLRYASMSQRMVCNYLFECGPSIASAADEIERAMDLSRRAQNRHAIEGCTVYRQVVRSLRGRTRAPGSLDDDAFDSARYERESEGHSWMVWLHAMAQAIAAAIFGDRAALALAVRRVAQGLVFAKGWYTLAVYQWLGAMSACWDLQEGVAQDDDPPPLSFDDALHWVSARADEAPFNFRHWQLHLLAERAWAQGDGGRAAALFDHALAAVDRVSRPWHAALITERAARLHLALGWRHSGEGLLARAHGLYQAWGAAGKAAQLARQLPRLALGMRPIVTPPAPTADEPDIGAVLRATLALGAETSTYELKARVEDVLGSLTGATRAVLALREGDGGEWAMPQQQRLPLAALRYAQRTKEPLLLTDAVADDRFGREEYFRGMERCSLAVVPILRQGRVTAMLVLENAVTREAFDAAQLDAVMMIAGQLAVSLESAQLYERLERKVREQTRQLREAQSRLLAEARRAGMAQIATNVLHNVGNVLNSVNVSAHVLSTRVRESRSARVDDLAQLLEGNARDLGRFFEADEKGRLLPGYVRELADALRSEQDELLGELDRLAASVDHIKNVVAMQQSYAGASGVREPTRLDELVDDALRMQEDALARASVKLERNYSPMLVQALDKTRVMQILVNLIENARHAMQAVSGERTLSVDVREEADWVYVGIRDRGCGISDAHLRKIFAHGFTTRLGGHGFGLHSSALAAQEMGGILSVCSDGPGTGATFTLRLPKTTAASAT